VADSAHLPGHFRRIFPAAAEQAVLPRTMM
jgi:hypothetical protein